MKGVEWELHPFYSLFHISLSVIVKKRGVNKVPVDFEGKEIKESRPELDLWVLRLDEPVKSLDMLQSLLSRDEQERANRFAFERDRNQYIRCRGVLRILLGHYCDQTPREVRFGYGKWGKPFLKEGGFCFNIAHSHCLALMGISRHGPLGVDIEQIRPFPEAQILAEQFFSEQEKKIIRQEKGDLKSFFQIWARKEAFIKALGKGLSQPLDRFDVVDESGGKINCMTDPERANEEYQLRDLSVDPDYSAALCFRSGGEPHIRIRFFSVAALSLKP